MSSWKSIALVAIGFNVGMIYATACSTDGKSSMDAEADPGEDCSTDDCNENNDDDFHEPDDDDHQNDGVTAADLAELASEMADLAANFASLQSQLLSLQVEHDALQTEHETLQASVLCYIGHQTDSQRWDNTSWETISGSNWMWKQGSNSDASQAYSDCF